MGSSCTTLNPVKVVKPFKNTPGESSTQPDTLQIEEKRSSTDRKGSKKYKKGLDECSTYIGSVPLNSRNNIVSTGDCLEEGARLPSLHFLTEEDCGEAPAMLEESQSKKSAHFEKGPLIGKGSCGEVYECLNLKTGELVAVKEIRLSGGVSEIQRYTSVLKKENVLFKTLNHPNIIRHYETEIIELKDQTHLLINISVEYVSGGSIRTLLNKFRNLDEKVVMIYMRQILEGLSYLHRMGIVHTNLKGTNILIDASGIVKLSDFGSLRLDRFSEENPLNSNRMSATAKNFMHWAAPEVMKSQKYSKAADVWSAGCVIIEMLTGSPPWNTHGDNFEETLNMISCGNLPPLPAYTSDICRDFLQKTFQLKPEDRATVDDLLDHPFVRDVTPSNSYFESDTLLSGLSGRASEMRNNSSYERYLNPRGNELRVPYLDITAHKGQFLRNRLRRGYPNEYVMKGGIIKSPSNSNAVPVNEIEVEELDMEPITLKVPVPTLNKVKEAPSEDEFTPNTSQKQFFASRPRHLLGKASRERIEKEAKEMTEEEKAEKRRQLELEMMMELDQQSLNESNAEDTDRLVEREALNQEQVEQEAEDEKPEEERLKTIPDEGALTTENSIMDCRGMDISEELDPQKEDQGSAEDPQKSLEDEIEKRFAEIRSNNSRTFWTWERENENEDQNENEENDGRQTGKDDETRETNNPVSIIDCQTLKSQEIKQMVVHPKSEKRLIMPNPEMIKITKKRGSDGKSDDHGRGNLTDVIELPEDEGGIHRRELSLRFSSELYQTMKSPQALEYLEKKLNAIGEVVEREENKEVSRDYDDKENRGFNIYMS